MNSLDTNILVYAVNQDCDENSRAKKIYEKMLFDPRDWIISDQVLLEFYRALRNPKILEKPLSHLKAKAQVFFIREKSGVFHCDYETDFWSTLWNHFDESRAASIHIFDCRLGATLQRNGVKTFYTRNSKDFQKFDFKSINPID